MNTKTAPTPLVDAATLRALLDAANPPRLFDAGFDLGDAALGHRQYLQAHLPGAHYLHLEHDLSGPKHDAAGRFRGRHPLPERAAFAGRIGALGIAPRVQVVAYDAQGGPYAARAWWLLRWLGHADVAVLDGGTAVWVATGGALTTDVPPAPGGAAYPASATPAMPVIDADALRSELGRVQLIDARAPERFRGEVEPLDSAAGHIPGARNRCFKDNLGPDGRFKSADRLRADFAALVAGPGAVVQYCGSGVTACHNLLAAAHAGLGDSVLYPGSWSEWSADAGRPRAQG